METLPILLSAKDTTYSITEGTDAQGTKTYTVKDNTGTTIDQVKDTNTTNESITVTGTDEKTVTLTDSNGNAVTTTFTDKDTVLDETSEGLKINGDNLTLSVKDTEGNEVSGSVSLADLKDKIVTGGMT